MQIMATSLVSLLVTLMVCATSTHGKAEPPNILVYTKTAGYRHESIGIAVDTIRCLGNGSIRVDEHVVGARWAVENTEDEHVFGDLAYLMRFDAVGFVSTTDVDPPRVGTVVDDDGLRNLAMYVQRGGGFFGIHSASATLFGVPFYGRLLGAFFDYHPSIQNVTVKPVEAESHPSTSKWPPNGVQMYEEVYNFRSDPRRLASRAHVILTNASGYVDPGVNAQGFRNGSNGMGVHPLAWWREGALLDEHPATDASVRGGGGARIQVSGGPGRSWYTSLGHANATWQMDLFRTHVAGGIGWVLQSPTAPSKRSSTSASAESTPAPVAVSTSSSATTNPCMLCVSASLTLLMGIHLMSATM